MTPLEALHSVTYRLSLRGWLRSTSALLACVLGALAIARLLGCPLLLGLIFGVLIASLLSIRFRWFGRANAKDAAQLIDSQVGAAERNVTFAELLSDESRQPQRELIERQLTPMLTHFTPTSVVSLRPDRQQWLSLLSICTFLVVLLWPYQAASPLVQAANSIDDVLAEHPELPQELREALQKVASELLSADANETDLAEAIEKAEEVLSEAITEERERNLEAREMPPVEDAPTPTPSSQASQAPSPTPSPKPGEQEKSEKKDTDVQNSKSTSGEKDEKQQENQEQKQGEKGQQGQEGKDQQQSPGGEEGEGDGSGKSGGGTEEGEGESKDQQGAEASQSGGGGKGDKDSKQEGQTNPQSGSGEKQGEGGEKGDQSADAKSGSKGMQAAKEALDKAKDASKEAKEAGEKEQQSQGAQGGSKGDEKKDQQDASGGKGGERPQPDTQESKGSEGEKGKEGEKGQGQREKTAPGDVNQSGGSDSDSEAQKSSLPKGQAEEKRFGDGPEGPGVGPDKDFAEVVVKDPNEQVDTRFVGPDGELRQNPNEAQVKTKRETVKLEKPDALSERGEQPIPLEYRDILR